MSSTGGTQSGTMAHTVHGGGDVGVRAGAHAGGDVGDDGGGDVGFEPLALGAACILPGLGHVVRGERLRGVCAGCGVLGLFVGGMVVGGIDVIDRREDTVWFVGQAMVGPLAFVVDHVHQTRFKVIDPLTGMLRSAQPDEGRDPASGRAIEGGTPPNTKSVGKANELGMLAATLGGMLNFIVIIDAGFPSRRRARGGGGRA